MTKNLFNKIRMTFVIVGEGIAILVLPLLVIARNLMALYGFYCLVKNFI